MTPSSAPAASATPTPSPTPTGEASPTPTVYPQEAAMESSIDDAVRVVNQFWGQN
ncbi:hypothetical protein GCM10025780_08690 [Frondihabitans cladoniiphilus]|uniref:Uncharacterized protein n=1 Tax=Frondihabitans cladoniiphilus TaxID=715785 RepID=A0ABP8VN50_9MICO